MTCSRWYCVPDLTAVAVRNAIAIDIPAIVRVDHLTSPSPWSEQSLSRYCPQSPADSHNALVAEVGEELAGFLIYSRVLEEANIDNVAVHPQHQGRGIGRALVQTALGAMPQKGIRRCLLEVRESNVAARALYENNGFVVDGVRPRYYKTEQGREDALLMSRRF